LNITALQTTSAHLADLVLGDDAFKNCADHSASQAATPVFRTGAETGLIERLSGEMRIVESDTLTQITHQSDFYAIGETEVEPPAWLDEAFDSQ